MFLEKSYENDKKWVFGLFLVQATDSFGWRGREIQNKRFFKSFFESIFKVNKFIFWGHSIVIYQFLMSSFYNCVCFFCRVSRAFWDVLNNLRLISQCLFASFQKADYKWTFSRLSEFSTRICASSNFAPFFKETV